jgi:hypothetical protein
MEDGTRLLESLEFVLTCFSLDSIEVLEFVIYLSYGRDRTQSTFAIVMIGRT